MKAALGKSGRLSRQAALEGVAPHVENTASLKLDKSAMWRRRTATLALEALKSRVLVAGTEHGASILPVSLEQNSHLLPVASSWLQSCWHLHSVSYSKATHQQRVSPSEALNAEEVDARAAANDSEQATATSASEAAAGGQDPYANLSPHQLQSLIREKVEELDARKAEADELSEKLVRTLADMENLRQRFSRQAENTKQYAIQGFVKRLLDVGDNLERAASAVPEGALSGKGKDGRDLPSEHLVLLLTGLLNGVKLTEKIFDQALRQNGVEKFRPDGEQFDPNKHEALFEMADASKEPGTVGTVSKTGYALNGRVVRPAQVGVVRAPVS